MARLRLLLMAPLLALLAAAPAWGAAVEPRVFDSPEQEARFDRLIEELRCLVCQNQNLADSDADLAQDLRRETYEMLRAGKTDEEILTFMVERYGDFVLYRPPVKSTTFLLWFGPFLLVGVGVAIVVMQVRRRRAARAHRDETPDLAATDRQRLDDLLGGSGGGSAP